MQTRCETVNHLLEYPGLKANFDSLSDKLKIKARDLNSVDGDEIVKFITNMDQILLLLGGL